MAASESATLVRSMRPTASGLRNSGSSSGPATISTAMTGTASRNTEPHHQRLRSTPPITGPSAPPANMQVAQTEIARAALPVVAGHVADQRQGRRRHGGRREAEQRAGDDQQLRTDG